MKLKNNILVLYGQEKYLIDKCNEEIIKSYLNDEYIEFNLIKIDYRKLDFSSIIDNFETLPLFDDYKIIIIKGLDLSKEGISKNKEFLNDFTNYLNKISTFNILIINSPTEKVYKGKFYKEIIKYGEIIEYKKYDYKRLIYYLEDYFNNKRIKYTKSVLDYIIDKSSYLNKDYNKNLYDLNNELNKIDNQSKITKEYIDTVFSNSLESNIFKLTDAILIKNLSLSIKIFNEINLKNDSSFAIFYMVARTIRNILYTKECKRLKKDYNEMEKIISISPYELKKIDNMAKKWSYNDLKKSIHLAYKTEYLLKTTSLNKGLIVENFIMGIII